MNSKAILLLAFSFIFSLPILAESSDKDLVVCSLYSNYEGKYLVEPAYFDLMDSDRGRKVIKRHGDEINAIVLDGDAIFTEFSKKANQPHVPTELKLSVDDLIAGKSGTVYSWFRGDKFQTLSCSVHNFRLYWTGIMSRQSGNDNVYRIR